MRLVCCWGAERGLGEVRVAEWTSWPGSGCRWVRMYLFLFEVLPPGGQGVGEDLQPLESAEEAWYVVIHPGVAVGTRDVFQSPELTRNSPIITIRDFFQSGGSERLRASGACAICGGRGSARLAGRVCTGSAYRDGFPVSSRPVPQRLTRRASRRMCRIAGRVT